jgi:LSD1 subclass zinc finger protein
MHFLIIQRLFLPFFAPLAEHQVGKVYCGQCDTLLMYPFGAPAVKCSNCLFVTDIGVSEL